MFGKITCLNPDCSHQASFFDTRDSQRATEYFWHIHCPKCGHIEEGNSPIDMTQISHSDAQRLELTMMDWNEEKRTELSPTFTAKIEIGNQISVDMYDQNKEPVFGLILEINHDTPAVHIDINGEDPCLHMHKGQDELFLTPNTPFCFSSPSTKSELTYFDSSTLAITPL